MTERKTIITVLKIILGIYILLCLGIAGLNYAVAPGANPETSEIITNIWEIYENEFKTLLILICSILSIMLIRKSENKKLRRRNFYGFIVSALIVHIAGPIVTGTKELYFFSMPLPWSSLSIQLFDAKSVYHTAFVSHWGASGLEALLIFVLLYNFIILTGTFLFGRRLQCSQICLFNGFASEIFAEAYPLVGKKKRKAGKKLRKLFSILRLILFASAVFFTVAAALSAAGSAVFKNSELLYKIETYKYLSLELLTAMFFWVVFTGRGYCCYCPAGTLVALISKVSGQRIRTDLDKCIKCGKCSEACAMSIDVRKFALEKKPVISMNCTGCGHCIDVCPTGTLKYSTRFLDAVKS